MMVSQCTWAVLGLNVCQFFEIGRHNSEIDWLNRCQCYVEQPALGQTLPTNLTVKKCQV